MMKRVKTKIVGIMSLWMILQGCCEAPLDNKRLEVSISSEEAIVAAGTVIALPSPDFASESSVRDAIHRIAGELFGGDGAKRSRSAVLTAVGHDVRAICLISAVSVLERDVDKVSLKLGNGIELRLSEFAFNPYQEGGYLINDEEIASSEPFKPTKYADLGIDTVAKNMIRPSDETHWPMICLSCYAKMPASDVIKVLTVAYDKGYRWVNLTWDGSRDFGVCG